MKSGKPCFESTNPVAKRVNPVLDLNLKIRPNIHVVTGILRLIFTSQINPNCFTDYYQLL